MQAQYQQEEPENIRLLSYLQATAETVSVPIQRGDKRETQNLNTYMTQAMQHTELGVISLSAPLQSMEESKEENEQQEVMTTQNGEGFVISSIEGVPTTEEESKREDPSTRD